MVFRDMKKIYLCLMSFDTNKNVVLMETIFVQQVGQDMAKYHVGQCVMLKRSIRREIMNKLMKKTMVLSVIGGLVIQLAACGTIMHPERKGQQAGQLDSGIVILDAIGLLFFLVPGVIAFAVDFNNGTIYLPGGSVSINSDELNVVTITGDITNEKIEQLVFEETGKTINLDENEVRSSEITTTISSLKSELGFL